LCILGKSVDDSGVAERGLLTTAGRRGVSISNGGNRRWKHQEQRIARALGTSLIANNGARRSDLEAGQYGIEVKTMKAIPVRVRKAMEQSVEACEKTNKVPVVVLSQPRVGKKPLRLVVMRFEDWQMNNAPRRVAPSE
jgi:hypothetical protein